MDDVLISMIAAVASNNVIGADNDMPWRLSTDLKRFKSLTLGKPIVMGRRTYDSVGKALPERLNIVVTRNAGLELEGARVVSSLDLALDIARDDARQSGLNEVMITGGGQIYADALDRSDRLYITHVNAQPDGDTVFPEIDPNIWRSTFEESVPKGEKDNADTVFRIYDRI